MQDLAKMIEALAALAEGPNGIGAIDPTFARDARRLAADTREIAKPRPRRKVTAAQAKAAKLKKLGVYIA